ncbi:PA14 domain-containing protein [Streptomyces griseorubiginosus]|uniref:PA14 domain-containing protein n=1 Tax=Streptomyces griseorubiginosus TaxID=67304 RepID=UPI0036EBAE01
MKSASRTTATALVLATAGTLFTATTPSASAAVSCASPVFQRQFYANTSFSGAPKKTDCDDAIDQSWSGSPASGLPKDNFGVRWSVTRDFGSGGPFALNATGLDGIRVYVDGVRKIDLWKNVSTTVKKTANVTIPRRQAHPAHRLRELDRHRQGQSHLHPPHHRRRRQGQTPRAHRHFGDVRQDHRQGQGHLGEEQGDGPRGVPLVPPSQGERHLA